MHVLHVVGARPNFMKAAPVLRALTVRGIRQTLIHTGQHYDTSMSDIFFRQLEMPLPDFNLGVGSGTHAQQTAAVMTAIEPILLEQNPDLLLVYGDVNSTLAAALVASKLAIRVGHVEAGLRSGDRSMPEELNRLLTDQLSDLLFTPSTDGNENLIREGVAAAKIHLVGNVMIDSLVRLLPRALETLPADLPSSYALVTLHRPSNVDDLPWLRELLATLADLSHQLHVVFPVHPRTRQRLESIGGLPPNPSRLRLMEPQPYLEFLALQSHAAMVITDSGGIQEETTFLGVPCLTVRENTERPITLTRGTNRLVGRNPKSLRDAAKEILSEPLDVTNRSRAKIPLWDGHASDRIAEAILSCPGSIKGGTD
ncbi:MAG TPA: UDP-N-acetylglucosamine 2-epimerase (non-hydrolyzing) [Candidatus Sulfotelmatobacter sp.]|nr:UDP-N-acetylglucosamine 2-epimerase (non-hydrolyzing) [Candidatus Sulfotelmatobacter sp.]